VNSIGLVSILTVVAIPAVAITLIVRAVSARRGGAVGGGHGVRRFFQYLLLLGLLVVTLVGLTELVGLALDTGVLADTGGALARGLTFTVFGGGLLAVVVAWTRRTVRDDPAELASVAWTVYLSLAGLVLAFTTASYVGGAVGVALSDTRALYGAIVGAVVWGAAWVIHWRLVRHTLDEPRSMALMVLGAVAGWAVSLTGLIGVLGQGFALLVPTTSLVGGGSQTAGLAETVGVLAAGALLWVPHWLWRLSRFSTGPVWHAYVLVVGVGASLVVTLTGVSITVYRLLEWFLGDPGQAEARAYLASTGVPVAMAVVGGLSWWYHRAVLASRAAVGRTEVTRVHEYLLAGIALAGAATGLALVVVALVDVLAPAPLVGSVVNSVLAAVTLLLVGGPLWWWFWRRVEQARSADPVGEVASPTRRVYLVLLFGVAGLVAVVVVLVAAFIVVDDVIRSTLGAGTVRDLRVPLGILVAAGAVSGYHWMVQREDRALAPAATAHTGPRLVLLVGPRDDAMAAYVRRTTGARVDVWPADGPPWEPEAVTAAVGRLTGPRAMLISGPDGVRVVGSGSDAGQHRDEPGGGGEQGEAQLDQHAEPDGPQGDPGGVAGGDGVPQP
jgi:hypothetical protein